MLKKLIAIFTLLGFVFGAYFYVDSRYALSGDVRQIEQRLDQKIASDRLNSITERIWKLEDRHFQKKMPESVKEEYRKLQEEKSLLLEQIKKWEVK